MEDSSSVFGEKDYALRKLLYIQEQLAECLLGEKINLRNFTCLKNRQIPYLQGFDPQIDEELRFLRQETEEKNFFVKDLYSTYSSIYARPVQNEIAPFREIINSKYPRELELIK